MVQNPIRGRACVRVCACASVRAGRRAGVRARERGEATREGSMFVYMCARAHFRFDATTLLGDGGCG